MLDPLELRNRPARDVIEVAAEDHRISGAENLAILFLEPRGSHDGFRSPLELFPLERVLRQGDKESRHCAHQNPPFRERSDSAPKRRPCQPAGGPNDPNRSNAAPASAARMATRSAAERREARGADWPP